MPAYKYTALNNKGRTVRGSITAANEIDLEERIRTLGFDLLDYKQAKESRFSFGGSVSMKELILVCMHLEQLERAGVPILESIADLRDTADSKHLKNLMADIYEQVKGGKHLSEAFKEHPKVFGDVFTGLIAAAEKTGNLAVTFGHLGKHLKWVNYLRSSIKKATYYPIFLLFLMSGVVTLMMLFVIPQLSKFLLAQNFELPFYTYALIATSNFLQENWYYVFGTPVIIYFAISLAARTSEAFAYKLDAFILKMPAIGPTVRKIELARFCRFFSITFRSGIGILECLDTAGAVTVNRVMKESVLNVRKSVSEGNSITASLRQTGNFPSLVVRMFKVGEDSGNLETALENINFFYDQEVEDAVKSMIGMIQPTLTIVMGGIMMWVSMAVFGPLYSSFSKMKF